MPRIGGSRPPQGRSEIEPIKPGTQPQPQAIGGQEAVEGPEGLKDSAEVSKAQAQQEAAAKEREMKAMMQNATERMGEETMKAGVKKTQTSDEFDASQSGQIDPAGGKDRSRIEYREEDPQAVPHLRKDGSHQRWNVAEKKWE